MKRALFVAGLVVAGTALSHAATLDTVKQRGSLVCGVSTGFAGFSAPDSQGNFRGLDADYCRAIAAAVLGDATKVRFVALTAQNRFTALQSGEIDVLSRNTTWTMSRDTSLGLKFAGIMYYDGQGFMVNPAALKQKTGVDVKSAADLNGASVCTQTGTTTELNLADYFRSKNMTYEVVAFEKNEEVLKAYQEGRCDAYTTDQSGLYVEKLKLPDPAANVVLPEIISKEPLGPAVRQGDDEWFNIVKWTYFALLNAEELGVTQANVEEQKNSTNPEIKRLLGGEGDFGKGIKLENDWVVRIVKGTGNYGEIFERNVGESTNLKIARGKNALWSKGGLQYAPPIR